jgi:shikimate kinase
VLREGNRTALQRNGRVIFLDRPLDRLACTEDRPLSSDREKLTRLYSERMPVYRTASDCAVKADAEPETVADRVWEAFQQ